MDQLLHLLQHSALLADASSIINTSAGQACSGNCGTSSVPQLFGEITKVLSYLIGSISVVMIIIGGLRYVLANGDSKQAAEARNTILFSVIGIIIAITAFGIVTFVTTHFK
ncbi:hypothetical protein HJC99_01290 [Candidatus Saccharibacteria bacterium]|nr:hypothetical protein [Candidatus Saccharibacteria bacterium]